MATYPAWAQTSGSRGGLQASLVLALLKMVHVLNFLDRQLPSILARPIHRGNRVRVLALA
jgi:hypothetical protein